MLSGDQNIVDDQLLRPLAGQRSEEIPLQRERPRRLPAARRRERHARAGRPIDRRGGAHRAACRGGGGRARAAADDARQLRLRQSPSSACSSSAPTRRRKWPTPSKRCSARSRISTASSARPSNTPTAGSAMRAARRRRSPRRRRATSSRSWRRRRASRSASCRCSAEYQRAEDVTRKRLYLETIERIFQSSNKIILEGDIGLGRAALPAARPAAAQRQSARRRHPVRRDGHASRPSVAPLPAQGAPQ